VDADTTTLRKDKPDYMPPTNPRLVDMAKQGDAELGELCVLYWQPVHVFIRCWLARYGRGPQDARDLTQDFMKELLIRGVGTYEREYEGQRRPFRFWLLGAVKHFLSKHFNGRQGRLTDSWDALKPEQRAHCEPRLPMSPERMFTITFASCVGEQAWQTTRAWYAARGDVAIFDRLERFIPGDELADFDYAAAANELGQKRDWVRQAVSRLRIRFQENLRGQVRSVVPLESDVDSECRALFGVGADRDEHDDDVVR
jgi:hypothetical protein